MGGEQGKAEGWKLLGNTKRLTVAKYQALNVVKYIFRERVLIVKTKRFCISS